MGKYTGTASGKAQGAAMAEKFKRKAKKAMGSIAEALMDGGLSVEREAKINCPVDTGRLRASITTRQTSETLVEVGTNVEYAENVEYGTSKQRAQPYLHPAYEAKKEEVKRRIAKALKEAMRTK